MNFKNVKSAFTLAEVLITLAILGVISALAIPTFVANSNGKEISAASKKAYSSLCQAYKAILSNNDGWDWSNGSYAVRTVSMKDSFKKYLTVVKDDAAENIFPTAYAQYNNNTPLVNTSNWTGKSALILNDGIYVFFDPSSNVCNKSLPCGQVFVDVNGKKGPNKVGKDFIEFNIDNGDILPYGADGVTSCASPYDWVHSIGCSANFLLDKDN